MLECLTEAFSVVKRNEYYPILLWDQVRNSGYYTPSSYNPYSNWCDSPSLIALVNYSREPQVTMCPQALISPTTSSLGEPGTHGNAADSAKEFSLYYHTVSCATNHELFHVAYPGGKPTLTFHPLLTGVLIPSFELQSS